jgi:hypothetical protein
MLMTARDDQDPEGPFVEYLRVLHAKRSPDLIVSLGAPAVGFVQRHRQGLFANTPMVSEGFRRRRFEAYHGDIVCAPILRQMAEYSHFVIRARLHRDCFSVGEVDEDLETLDG